MVSANLMHTSLGFVVCIVSYVLAVTMGRCFFVFVTDLRRLDARIEGITKCITDYHRPCNKMQYHILATMGIFLTVTIIFDKLLFDL